MCQNYTYYKVKTNISGYTSGNRSVQLQLYAGTPGYGSTSTRKSAGTAYAPSETKRLTGKSVLPVRVGVSIRQYKIPTVDSSFPPGAHARKGTAVRSLRSAYIGRLIATSVALISAVVLGTVLQASTSLSCDAPEPWLLGFQDGASPTFEGITELHDTIFFYLVLIGLGVAWVMASVVINFGEGRAPLAHRYANHGTLIEVVWTVTPALVLVAIAFPSFKLLYLMDIDFVDEAGEAIEYDSYMVPDSDLEDGQIRLLEVDNRVVLPVDTHVRFVVTGADVIHDFAVPSLGIKIDACPGRLNQTSVIAQREGVFFGQCSELCGVYHGFMPIAVEVVGLDQYLVWLDSQT
nr:cytochrome c oxidase subunit 2, mitochondrial [Tanacetum cinerariifolium]